jgi:hypothetical protein
MAIAFLLQWCVAIPLHLPAGDVVGAVIFSPMLVALVYSFARSDTSETPLSAQEIWERLLERAWAVVIVDFITGWIFANGFYLSLSPTIGPQILGVMLMAVSIPLVFADASAVADDNLTAWNVIPLAFLNGIRRAYAPAIFPRALLVYALNALFFFSSQELAAGLDAQHVANPLFWGTTPLNTLVTPGLAVLTMVIYRDGSSDKQAT